jgi:hypothetical protein
MWLESYLGPLRHAREPKLRAVKRDAVPASADLRREHCPVLIVKQKPRDELGAIIRGEMLDRDLHGGNVARRVVRALELRWPRQSSNNRKGCWPRFTIGEPIHTAKRDRRAEKCPNPARTTRASSVREPRARRRKPVHDGGLEAFSKRRYAHSADRHGDVSVL